MATYQRRGPLNGARKKGILKSTAAASDQPSSHPAPSYASSNRPQAKSEKLFDQLFSTDLPNDACRNTTKTHLSTRSPLDDDSSVIRRPSSMTARTPLRLRNDLPTPASKEPIRKTGFVGEGPAARTRKKRVVFNFDENTPSPDTTEQYEIKGKRKSKPKKKNPNKLSNQLLSALERANLPDYDQIAQHELYVTTVFPGECDRVKIAVTPEEEKLTPVRRIARKMSKKIEEELATSTQNPSNSFDFLPVQNLSPADHLSIPVPSVDPPLSDTPRTRRSTRTNRTRSLRERTLLSGVTRSNTLIMANAAASSPSTSYEKCSQPLEDIRLVSDIPSSYSSLPFVGSERSIIDSYYDVDNELSPACQLSDVIAQDRTIVPEGPQIRFKNRDGDSILHSLMYNGELPKPNLRSTPARQLLSAAKSNGSTGNQTAYENNTFCISAIGSPMANTTVDMGSATLARTSRKTRTRSTLPLPISGLATISNRFASPNISPSLTPRLNATIISRSAFRIPQTSVTRVHNTTLRKSRKSRNSTLVSNHHHHHITHRSILVVNQTSSRPSSPNVPPADQTVSEAFSNLLYETVIRTSTINSTLCSGGDLVTTIVRAASPSSQDKEEQSIKNKVLSLCNPKDIVSFEAALGSDVLQRCTKIGEGSYGEVFKYKDDATSGNFVIKIIPLNMETEEGLLPEIQEELIFGSVLPELTVSHAFDPLCKASAKSSKSEQSPSHEINFICTHKTACARGTFPSELIQEWDKYAAAKESLNEDPRGYQSDQLYIIFQLNDGGEDLESFHLSDARQALSIIQQMALSLAAAEELLEFEHRDLHLGNVLVARSEKTHLNYNVAGKEFRIASQDLFVSIIDFSLSRIKTDKVLIFDDLEKDEVLFEGEGDTQFEVYRLMRERCGGDWASFTPYSNLLWLEYTIGKLLDGKKYRARNRDHKSALDSLRELRRTILDYQSTMELIANNQIFTTHIII